MIITTNLNEVFVNLTVKQREVLDLLGDGLTSKEIARNLGVSPSAIDQRLKALKERFGTTSRNELARLCRQGGISVLNGAEQSVVRQAISPADRLERNQNADAPILNNQVKLAPSPMRAANLFHYINHARFLLGFVLGFLAGGVVAGSAVTFVFRTILAAI